MPQVLVKPLISSNGRENGSKPAESAANGDTVYVRRRNNGYPSGLYVVARTASQMTGYTPQGLHNLARNGKIKEMTIKRKHYFLGMHLDQLSEPEGYMYVKAAAKIVGYTEKSLRALASQGKVRRKYYRRRLYLSIGDLLEYSKAPRGFINVKEASADYEVSTSYLWTLVSSGILNVTKKNGISFLSVADLRNHFQPEGFISYEEAASEFGYSALYMKKLAKRQRFETRSPARKVLVKKDDVERYVAGLNGRRPASVDNAPGAEESLAEAVSIGVQPNGQERDTIIQLFDRLAVDSASEEDLVDRVAKEMGISTNGKNGSSHDITVRDIRFLAAEFA